MYITDPPKASGFMSSYKSYNAIARTIYLMHLAVSSTRKALKSKAWDFHRDHSRQLNTVHIQIHIIIMDIIEHTSVSTYRSKTQTTSQDHLTGTTLLLVKFKTAAPHCLRGDCRQIYRRQWTMAFHIPKPSPRQGDLENPGLIWNIPIHVTHPIIYGASSFKPSPGWLPSRNLTKIPKMMVFELYTLSNMVIFGISVQFQDDYVMSVSF